MAAVVAPEENYWPAILISLALHAVIVGLLVFGFHFGSRSQPAVATKIIDAEVVDSGVLEAIEAEKRRKQEAIEAEKRRREEQRRQEELRRQQEQQRIEQERLAKIAEEKRIAEQKRIAEEKRVAEQKRRAEEAERQRVEEQKRIAEQKRRAEEQRLLEQEQRAEWEKLQAEEARAAAAARSRELAGKRTLYIDSIRHKVERNWIRPASAQLGDACTVNVLQIPGGDVVDVSVESCIGDAAFQRSVEAAVRKAAPLPDPPDPALFDRHIQFTFKVKE
jgi:colicin import membrane protein